MYVSKSSINSDTQEQSTVHPKVSTSNSENMTTTNALDEKSVVPVSNSGLQIPPNDQPEAIDSVEPPATACTPLVAETVSAALTEKEEIQEEDIPAPEELPQQFMVQSSNVHNSEKVNSIQVTEELPLKSITLSEQVDSKPEWRIGPSTLEIKEKVSANKGETLNMSADSSAEHQKAESDVNLDTNSNWPRSEAQKASLREQQKELSNLPSIEAKRNALEQKLKGEVEKEKKKRVPPPVPKRTMSVSNFFQPTEAPEETLNTNGTNTFIVKASVKNTPPPTPKKLTIPSNFQQNDDKDSNESKMLVPLSEIPKRLIISDTLDNQPPPPPLSTHPGLAKEMTQQILSNNQKSKKRGSFKRTVNDPDIKYEPNSMHTAEKQYQQEHEVSTNPSSHKKVIGIPTPAVSSSLSSVNGGVTELESKFKSITKQDWQEDEAQISPKKQLERKKTTKKANANTGVSTFKPQGFDTPPEISETHFTITTPIDSDIYLNAASLKESSSSAELSPPVTPNSITDSPRASAFHAFSSPNNTAISMSPGTQVPNVPQAMPEGTNTTIGQLPKSPSTSSLPSGFVKTESQKPFSRQHQSLADIVPGAQIGKVSKSPPQGMSLAEEDENLDPLPIPGVRVPNAPINTKRIERGSKKRASFLKKKK